MILLHAITKTYSSKHGAPEVVFRPTTIALPTDRRVAVLGERLRGNSVLLRLLAGQEPPDAGAVVAPVRLSPIANAATLFNPRFSPIENIWLVARMLGVAGAGLAALVDAFCGLGPAMEMPVSFLNASERQRLNIALVALLSFDCYLLDNARSVPTELLEGYFHAAAARGAGLIFTTNLPRQVHQYAEHAVVIRDRTVLEFDHVAEAVRSYERKQG
jgi:ABC-type polysaccharide/polyol phosphate transport system ATPase subunit